MSSLLIVMGLPSKEKNLYLKKQNKLIVDLEELRKGVTGSYTNDTEDDHLISQLSCQTVQHYLSQKQAVAINGLFFTKKSRLDYIELAKRMNVPINLYWFDTKLSDFQDYLLSLPSSVREEKGWSTAAYIENTFSTFEFPSLNEGFKNLKYN